MQNCTIPQCQEPSCKHSIVCGVAVCWHHLKERQGLEIKQSLIPNAGLGLFTSIPRQKGELIDVYADNHTMQRESKRSIDRKYGKKGLAAYTWCNQAGICWDAINTRSNFGRFANGCDKPGGELKCNAYINDGGNLIATTKIKAGEELLNRYGQDYWKQE